MRIVLDAMGGDFGPEITVAGAVMAAREFSLPLILVGRQATVQQELAKHDSSGLLSPWSMSRKRSPWRISRAT
jgi:glycerol-3-phosphate acyltransferase PlsX